MALSVESVQGAHLHATLNRFHLHDPLKRNRWNRVSGTPSSAFIRCANYGATRAAALRDGETGHETRGIPNPSTVVVAVVVHRFLLS